jgi:hypothetical protein
VLGSRRKQFVNSCENFCCEAVGGFPQVEEIMFISMEQNVSKEDHAFHLSMEQE